MIGAILFVALSTCFCLDRALGQIVAAPRQQLIRNFTPPAWEADDVKWARDVDPHNGIDDLIDASDDELFDVVINFSRCVTDDDIDLLNVWGQRTTVQQKLKYISSVAAGGFTKQDLERLLEDRKDDVAFVEQQLGFGPTLDVSVPNICVTAGTCSPNTVEEVFTSPVIDGTGVNIVIMDSGVDDPGGPGTTHLGFSSAVAFYDATAGTFTNPDDTLGHGTHVASIALGQGTTTTSRGVAPGANLIDVRISGSCTAAGWTIATDALQVTYDNRALWGVDVINMSFGQCDSSGTVVSDGLDAFSQLVDLAESMGIVVVAAAGNDGPTNVGLSTPAAATRAITVAASETQNTDNRADDDIACFSSRGPRGADGDADQIDELKPEVTAPGTHQDNVTPSCWAVTGILAADNDNTDATARKSGTSMAAPHVTGLAALIIQARPDINAASVKDLIISTATAMGPASLPLVDPVWNDGWGWGLVNAFDALNVTTETDLTYPSHPPTPLYLSPDISVSPDPPKVGSPATVTVDVRNEGPNDAIGVRIHFGVHVFSASTPTFYDIGTEIVDIPVDSSGSTAVSISWTPQAASHQCLKTEIGYGPDLDYTNNTAQRNVTVATSPATFVVRNTLTEEPVEITFVPTLDDPGHCWDLEIEPPGVTLAADDCPEEVQVELFPPDDAPPGSTQVVHVTAVVQTQDGPVQLGGVSVEARVPEEDDDCVFPECCGVGVCGVSTLGMLPLMLLGLVGMKASIRRRR